jgi:hypothetical protein
MLLKGKRVIDQKVQVKITFGHVLCQLGLVYRYRPA